MSTEVMVVWGFALALFMLGLGLRGIITQRPYLFSARWLMAFIALSFLPNMIMPALEALDEDSFMYDPGSPAVWLMPLMYLVMLAFFALMMRGYIAIGVTERSMRDALLAALDQLEIDHVERLGAVYIPSRDGQLQVAVQGWIGAGQLKGKGQGVRPLLPAIAGQMSEYFRDHKVQMNFVASIAYVAMSLMMIALFAVLALD